MSLPVDVVVVKKSGGVDQWGGAFQETAETLVYALRALGCDAELSYNRFRSGRSAVLLGALNLTAEETAALPPRTVVYNLEQVSARDVPMKPHYLALMRARPVWDYSRRNVTALSTLGVRARFVPVGYRPELTRIVPATQRDVDVLFYGAVNDRRRRVLEELAARGVETLALQNYYGALRDGFIARARVVLNMHFYDRGVFEIVRASYLFANKAAVAAERNPDTEIEPDMQDAACFAPYEGLADACVALLADDARRAATAERGFFRMSQRDVGRFLSAGLPDLERFA